MKTYLKCYRVFLCNKWLKWVIYLIYPVLTIGWSGLIVYYMKQSGAIGLAIAALAVIFMELFLDYYVFGGILCKDTNKLQYLMTSHKGMQVLEKSLLADKTRRLLSITIILIVIYGIFHEGVEMLQLTGSILTVATVTELALMVSRGFHTLAHTIIVSMVGAPVGMALLSLVFFLPSGYAVIFVIFYLVAGIVSNRKVINRAKEQYHDGKGEI